MLTVLVGMIASGKSTYARKMAERHGCIIVNDDAIVSAVHGGDYRLYSKELKPLYKAVEHTIASTAIALGRNVVVDRGVNVSAQSRQRWISMARCMDVKSACVVFPRESAHDHALRRTHHDPRGLSHHDWLVVAQSHEARYVEPTLDEGFDYVMHPYRKDRPLASGNIYGQANTESIA